MTAAVYSERHSNLPYSLYGECGALTMTYTLTAQPTTIIRDEDQAFIPTDPDNTDYAEYLAWLDEGNEPTPYTPPAKAKK